MYMVPNHIYSSTHTCRKVYDLFLKLSHTYSQTELKMSDNCQYSFWSIGVEGKTVAECRKNMNAMTNTLRVETSAFYFNKSSNFGYFLLFFILLSIMLLPGTQQEFMSLKNGVL